MWRTRRPTEHSLTDAEKVINTRDKTIRGLIDDLVDGTRELQKLYTNKDVNGTEPQPGPQPR